MQNIKELRVKTGLSQKKFADKFKLNVRTLQDWELGRHNAPEHIIHMISRILELEDNNTTKINMEDET